MQQVTIKIGESYINHNFSEEKIKYLLKFINSITDETDEKTDLMKEIEISLQQVKKIRNGELPRKSIKQMIDGK
ncbi:MAG: hypothetical protein A2033_04385 [Bacteroidetes bacterium GWA2_31_9]|nr:MAG: hypothetical protein A2033_04385 [Bacteroidetes bacterium GWA2_31_9]